MDTKPFDVFISHSSKDMHTASAIKQHLQAAGIRCWKAPDDIMPGESWPQAIMRALGGCRTMVLVWSANSTQSPEVSKELTLAMQGKVTVIPFRIEDVQPSGEWAYHLANTHWMNAFPGQLEEHLDGLAAYIGRILPDRAKVPSTEASSATAAPTLGLLEKLVEAAVSDGVVTDEELKILSARAEALGVGDAELQLLIRAKLDAVPKPAKAEPAAPPAPAAATPPPKPPKPVAPAVPSAAPTGIESPALKTVHTQAAPKPPARAAKPEPLAPEVAAQASPAKPTRKPAAARQAAEPKHEVELSVPPPSALRGTIILCVLLAVGAGIWTGVRRLVERYSHPVAMLVQQSSQPEEAPVPSEPAARPEPRSAASAPVVTARQEQPPPQAPTYARPEAPPAAAEPQEQEPVEESDAFDGNVETERIAGRTLPRVYESVVGPGFSCNGSLNRAETAICSDPRLARADGILNAVYSDVRRALPPEEAARLKTQQLAWLKVRDTQCRFVDESPFRGCLLSSLEQRIGELLDRRASLGG